MGKGREKGRQNGRREGKGKEGVEKKGREGRRMEEKGVVPPPNEVILFCSDYFIFIH